MIEQKPYHKPYDSCACTSNIEEYDLHNVQEILNGEHKEKVLIVQTIGRILVFNNGQGVLKNTYLVWNKTGYFIASQEVSEDGNGAVVYGALKRDNPTPIKAYLLNENNNDK